MNTTRYKYIIIIIFLICLPLELKAQQLKPIKLENNNGWLVNTNNGIHAELSISFPFGSIHDPKGMYGAAYFLGELLNNQKAWNLASIHSKIIIPTNSWLQLATTVEQDRFILHIGFPIAHIKGIPKIIDSLIVSQNLDSESFDSTKAIIINEINKKSFTAKANHLNYLLVNSVEPKRWQKPMFGSLESISTISKSNILSFMEESLRQNNVIYFLSGNIKKDIAEEFIEEINNVIPQGASKYIEESINIEKLSIKLPGFVERIKSPDDTASVVFTFKTPGWNSPNFLITWMIFKSLGCKSNGWLLQQLNNMIANAIEEADICWKFSKNEGLAVGNIILRNKNFSPVVYHSLLALLLNISKKGIYNKDWLTVGKDTLKAEWGVNALRSKFNYSFISKYLPITSAVWNPEELDKVYNKTVKDGLPHNVSSLFSPDNIHVLILN